MAYLTKKTYGDKLLDPRWQKKRLETLEKDGFACTRCGEKGKTLHVHHYCYHKDREPWDVPDYSITTLCCDCHKIEHLDNLTLLERDLINAMTTTAIIYQGKNELVNFHIKHANSLILKHKV